MPKILVTIALAALVGATALVGASIHEDGNVPLVESPDYVNVVKSLGGAVCSKEDWFIQKELGFADLYVGDQRHRCTQWTGTIPGVVIAATTVSLNSGLTPLVLYFPTQERPEKSVINTIIVDIVGGPSGSISPSGGNIIPPYLAKNGLTVASLGYTGTLYGSMYPKASYGLAVKDVVEYLEKIRGLSRRPAKIVLLGESLGGRIAIEAAHKMPVALRPDLVVLISPLMLSPISAERNFSVNLRNNPSNDSYITTRLISDPEKPWEKVGTIPLFDAFFEEKEKHRDLNEILELSPMIRPLIIFGTDDNVIGLNAIRHLSPKVARTFEIEGMGHHPNMEEEKQIVSVIESAIGVMPSVP